MPKLIDRTGHIIGRYTVIRRDGFTSDRSKRKRPTWIFQCPCGETFSAEATQVSNGIRSCSKCRRANRREDLAGQSFGRLTATTPNGTVNNAVVWNAECRECGKTFTRAAQRLKLMTVCPCYRARLTHGHTTSRQQTPTYKSWNAMVNRCVQPSTTRFDRYGGRGITVCDRWRSFENFLADMGERPKGTSLDRIDGDGNYEPGNCRWATRTEQRRNMDENTIITHDGATRTLAEWADMTGIDRHTLRFRYVRQGWTAARSLTEPVGQSIGKRGPDKRPRRKI